MNDIYERYARWAAQFDAKVSAVPADAWDNQSHIPEWTTRDVVAHVIDSTTHFLQMVHVPVSGDATVRTDPVEAWRDVRDAVLVALGDPAYAEQEVESMGQKTLWQNLADTFLSLDLVVHAWDVCRAAGIDDTLDLTSVEGAMQRAEPLAETGRQMGAFGPRVDVPDSASAQDRLVALLGRRP